MYLFGASGHGKVIAEAAAASGCEISGFVDENPAIQSLLKYRVFREIPADARELFISIGDNFTRKRIATQLDAYSFATIIHPFSSPSTTAEINQGTVILSGVSVNSGARIGQHCILNTNSSIDHDCELGDFVHISPNAALAGDVKVGEGTHIGMGACVIQGVKIGKWAVIGAGAVVIRDVPDFAVMVGNPAKQIKSVENTNRDR